MRGWVWILASALLISGAQAAEKKDKGGKDKAAAAKVEAKLPPGEQAVQQAEEQLRAGKRDDAVTVLRQATQAEGMTGEPFLRLAELLESSQEVDTALADYKVAAERLSGAPKAEAFARLSLLQDALGDLEGARASVQQAQAADPEGAWPAIALARARAREGKGDEALALAQKAAASGAPAAKAQLGFAQESRGDLAAAEAAYREALAQEPDRAETSVDLARVLRKTNRAAEADQVITRTLDQTPWLVGAYKESVAIKIALGQFTSALEQAQTAATLDDKDPEAQRMVDDVMVARALDYVNKGQPDLAIEDLVQLRDQKPQAVGVRVGLAKAYLAKKQLDLAQAELTKAIEVDPSAAEAHFQMGILMHEGKGSAAAALPEYEKAVALAPQNIDYRIRLGNLLSAQKQSERAITELRTVVEGSGAARADAWTYLGGAYLQASRYQDAVDALAKAFGLLPDEPQNKQARGLAADYMAWACLNTKDKPNFLKYGSLARELGFKEKDPALMQKVADIEAGKDFASAAAAKPAAKPRPRPRR